MRRRSDESAEDLQEQSPGRRYTSPESRLAAALIEQAIADTRDVHATTGLRKCALEWFGGAPAPLSFAQACTLAGIDANAALWRLASRVGVDLRIPVGRSETRRVLNRPSNRR